MIVGVDIGGTKIAAGIVTSSGRLSGDVVTLPTPAQHGPAAVLDAAATAVLSLVRGREGELSGVGVASAGTIDPVTGRVSSATHVLPGWAGTAIPEELRIRLDRTSIAVPVAVRNDVDAVAEGESWSGACAGTTSAVVVAVGTGVGGALVVNGEVLRGAHRAAGEIGHIPVGEAEDALCPCGRSGHLEAVAAGPAIERAHMQRTGSRLTGSVIAARAAAGDADAVATLASAGGALGRAIAGIVTTFDPEVVVLGGGVTRAGAPWIESVGTALRAELIAPLADVSVRMARHGDAAAVVGAARSLFDLRTVGASPA